MYLQNEFVNESKLVSNNSIDKKIAYQINFFLDVEGIDFF